MTYRPTLRSQQDLELAWRHLVQPLGFARPSLWFMFVGADDHPVPHLNRIEETDRPPTPDEAAALADVIRELGDELVPGGRVAFLRSRPGAPTVSAEDRAWARSLYDVSRLAGLPAEVVHLACDTDVLPLPVDDALPDSAA